MIFTSPRRPAFRAVGDVPVRDSADLAVVALTGLLVFGLVAGIWIGLLDDTEQRAPLSTMPAAAYQHPAPVTP